MLQDERFRKESISKELTIAGVMFTVWPGRVGACSQVLGKLPAWQPTYLSACHQWHCVLTAPPWPVVLHRPHHYLTSYRLSVYYFYCPLEYKRIFMDWMPRTPKPPYVAYSKDGAPANTQVNSDSTLHSGALFLLDIWFLSVYNLRSVAFLVIK